MSVVYVEVQVLMLIRMVYVMMSTSVLVNMMIVDYVMDLAHSSVGMELIYVDLQIVLNILMFR